jgi:hypothetical protein
VLANKRPLAATDPAEHSVDERHDRVEVATGDGAEHEDDREQAGAGRGCVLEELEPDVIGRELLGRDAGADHDRCEERGAKKLGEQPTRESWRGRHWPPQSKD